MLNKWVKQEKALQPLPNILHINAYQKMHQEDSYWKLCISEENFNDIKASYLEHLLVMQKLLLKVHASKAAIFSCRATTINLENTGKN